MINLVNQLYLKNLICYLGKYIIYNYYTKDIFFLINNVPLKYYSMDQEGANYFTTDSTFSVPIILSSEGLDTFANSTIPGDNDPIKDDSNDVPQVLQSDISQEQNINNTDKIDVPTTENLITGSETTTNQTQNLKVCILMR